MSPTDERSGRVAGPGAARPRVVVIGPMAPAVGGMTTVIEQLLAGPLSRSYEFIRRPANANVDSRRSWWRSCCRHLGQLLDLARRLGPGDADLVHIHTCSGFTFYRNMLDLLVARMFGVPVVLHVHGARFDRFCARSGRLGRRLIRHGLTAANRVLVLSRDWRQRLQPFAPQAYFTIVPNGVPCPTTAPARRDEATETTCRFLFLAAICRRKGLDVLIQAARQLRERGVNFRLTIAGPEEQPGQADQLGQDIQTGRLEACVEYVGTVTGPAKEDLLRQCDCLVLPSRAEGLPLTLLEAGAQALAVLATTVGAVPEVITGPQFGRLVSPDDATALSEAMANLATDGPLRTALGEALAQRITQHYSLQNQSDLLADLYEALGAERAAVPPAHQADLIRIVGEDSLARPSPADPTRSAIRTAHEVVL